MPAEFCGEILRMLGEAGSVPQEYEVVTLSDNDVELGMLKERLGRLEKQKASIESEISTVRGDIEVLQEAARSREISNMSNVLALLRLHFTQTARQKEAHNEELMHLKRMLDKKTKQVDDLEIMLREAREKPKGYDFMRSRGYSDDTSPPPDGDAYRIKTIHKDGDPPPRFSSFSSLNRLSEKARSRSSSAASTSTRASDTPNGGAHWRRSPSTGSTASFSKFSGGDVDKPYPTDDAGVTIPALGVVIPTTRVSSDSCGGVPVASVQSESVAEQIGILPGDIIFNVAGTVVTSLPVLQATLSKVNPSKDVRIGLFRRQGAIEDIVWKVGKLTSLKRPAILTNVGPNKNSGSPSPESETNGEIKKPNGVPQHHHLDPMRKTSTSSVARESTSSPVQRRSRPVIPVLPLHIFPHLRHLKPETDKGPTAPPSKQVSKPVHQQRTLSSPAGVVAATRPKALYHPSRASPYGVNARKRLEKRP
eukprot:Sspe_Gene.105987::Locus_83124_Transcript_1_1_Confidence_1.000_Length_1741::g.105987::m.105987